MLANLFVSAAGFNILQIRFFFLIALFNNLLELKRKLSEVGKSKDPIKLSANYVGYA